MRKALALLLILVYGFSSTGFTMHRHYCMGELVSTGFSQQTAGSCGKCGMPVSDKKKSCCKDVPQVKKLDQAHQKHMIKFCCDFAAAIIPVDLFRCSPPPGTYIFANSTKGQSPLIQQFWDIPLYLRYKVFRI